MFSMKAKNCFWIVFNRREGVIKSFNSQSQIRAAKWRKKNRPYGTRLALICIPPR